MALGQSSPYASPLSYSTPMTSMPTTASILGTMPSYAQGIQALALQPAAQPMEESNLLAGLMGLSQGLQKSKQPQMQPLQPNMQQYSISPMANIVGGLDMSILNQVLQQPMMEQQPTLLDYIRLLGGQG